MSQAGGGRLSNRIDDRGAEIALLVARENGSRFDEIESGAWVEIIEVLFYDF
ncbi:hypothetical protein [Amycolatopsis sp. lyj-109]|uniref:hypothetical protein n=1 Tax=Amycolatopsis sp. lyj-109 TaxID=2789287 RepID=UPI00397DF0EF